MLAMETELKFVLTPDEVRRLRTHPLLAAPDDRSRPGSDHLASTYYDTADARLLAAGLALRVRQAGGRRVQTVKRAEAGGLFGRGEWEREIAGDTPDLAAADGSPLADVLGQDDATALHPLFVTRISRQSHRVREGEAEVEVSLDEGEITAGVRRKPLAELELELKHGDAAALFDLARILGEAGPLRLSLISKAEAGYLLAGLGEDGAVKATRPAVRPGQTAAEAFQTIARASLAQLLRNTPLLLSRRSTAALHQMRVAIRRLRAALSAFRDVVADPDRARINAELKWLAGELDDARNLDVFVHETFEATPVAAADRLARAELGHLLLDARGRAYDRALAAVDGPRGRAAVLDAAAWIEAGDWLRAADGVNTGVRDCEAAAFAAGALSHRLKVLRKKARALKGDDPVRRHKCRIAAKKMRYAAEMFAPLYDHGRAAHRRTRFVARLKALQQTLGQLNDIAGAREAALLALRPPVGPASVEAAMEAGAMIAARGVGAGALTDDALTLYAAFEDAKRFW